MGLTNHVVWHHDPRESQLIAALEEVEQLCQNENTLLIFHFAGHGHGNGG